MLLREDRGYFFQEGWSSNSQGQTNEGSGDCSFGSIHTTLIASREDIHDGSDDDKDDREDDDDISELGDDTSEDTFDRVEFERVEVGTVGGGGVSSRP